MPSLTRFRGTPSGSAAARFLALSLWVVLSCVAAKRSRVVAPEAEPPLSVSGDRVSVNIGRLQVALEVLDAARRARFLEEHAVSLGADPFADDPRGRYRFVTFRLDLVNSGSEDINLHPSNLQAYADAVPYFPMEYTAFYEHFVSRLHLDEGVLTSLESAVLMSNLEVPARGRVSALVVFQGLPERFKRFRIACSSVLIGAESKSFVVPFGVVQERVRKDGSQ